MTKCIAEIVKLCLLFYIFHHSRVVDVKVVKLCFELIQNNCLTVMQTGGCKIASQTAISIFWHLNEILVELIQHCPLSSVDVIIHKVLSDINCMPHYLCLSAVCLRVCEHISCCFFPSCLDLWKKIVNLYEFLHDFAIVHQFITISYSIFCENVCLLEFIKLPFLLLLYDCRSNLPK